MGAEVTSMILVDVSITAVLLLAWRVVGYFVAFRRRPGGEGGGGGGHGPEHPLPPPRGPGGRALTCHSRSSWRGERPHGYCVARSSVPSRTAAGVRH